MGTIAIDTIARANREEMKIEHLMSINGAILMVYCINTSSYKYEIAFGDGSLYSPNELYYTAEKALKMGTQSIKIVIGY
jgi:hypothetical protein